MCGIIGGNNPDWNYNEAISVISHRGPNGQKIERIKGIFLGFARLAIIDLSEDAMQPMISEDGKYAIIFNGEIYDYKKIRNVLKKKGYHFRTESDTEVLLYAFIEWKEKAMDYIDGIYAFAVFDIESEKLYLFRDRCGIKPLYYYDNHAGEFAFASELKGIQTLCKGVKFTIDNTALYDYHTYLYIPEPKTMYKNVYKLPAAHYLVYDVRKRKTLELTRYWKVKLNTKEGNVLSKGQLDKKAEELRYHLDRIVARQIVADVPVGTFLSGGVDSSIITLVVNKHLQNVTGYTIGFPDKRYDESVYAKEMADIIGVNCKLKYFTLNDFNTYYRVLLEAYDEPHADTSVYPTYFVSKTAKEDVTVVLTGDGGDELFGGYFRCPYARDFLDKKKFSNRGVSALYLKGEKFLERFGREFKNACLEDIALLSSTYHYGKEFDREKIRRKYQIPKDYDDFWYLRKYYHKELPALTRMRYLDFMTYLNGDILTKVDRASMQVSLEARVPLLDREMVDFAFSLTQEECNPHGELKGLLKYAYQREIPRKLLDRKKQGFSIPLSYVRKGDCPQEYLIESLWDL